jgi:hypothetical protein
MGSELIVHSGDFEVNRTGFKGTAKGQKKQPMDGFLGGIANSHASKLDRFASEGSVWKNSTRA